MKEKIRNLVNKTYIVHAILIISMTQMFSFMKIFWIGGFVKDGSLGEFLTILGTIAVSIIALLAILCLTLEKDGNVVNTKKDHCIRSLFYLVITIILMWILYGIVGNDPLSTMFAINTHTDNIYNIVFNKTLYIIDMVLILAIYAFRKLYKLWDFLLQVLVFKVTFMIGIYLSIVSIVNISNAGMDRNTNSYIPVTMFCEKTYVETTNLFFFKNVDCPLSTSKNAEKENAISGSTIAYNIIMNKPLDLKEKAEITLKFYEANKKYDTNTWLENHYPNIYLSSVAYTSKHYYKLNKDSDVMLANLIIEGKMDIALEKAKSIMIENNKFKKEDLDRPTNKIAYNIVKNAEITK